MVETVKSTGAPALTGQVLLYKNPEPLSIQAHSKLGLKAIPEPFGFLRESHVLPLTVNEFGVAAGSFPIIFAPDKKTPLVVMGVNSGQNLIVEADGTWPIDVYLPAFARRYPFVFANDPEADQFLVCIDTQAPMIGENAEFPLFKDGDTTDYTKNAIEFLQEFERQRAATDVFMAAINEHDLIEERSVTYTPRLEDGSDGPVQKVADYLAVSEEKLNALPDAAYLKLREQGVLPAIYAHLVSILQWQRMTQIALKKLAQQEAQKTS